MDTPLETNRKRPIPAKHPGKLHRLLTSPRLPLVLALLAALLTLPSLGVGLLIDDNAQRIHIMGSDKLPEIARDPSQFFTFANGDPVQTRRLMERGLWPWWTYPNIHGAFWRPIAVLTHRVDFALWPDCPVLMHAQSIAWFAVLVALVTMLYRQVEGAGWIAGLAALLYAIDDARGMPVGFLANRNALVAAVFGVGTIHIHDRWRREDWSAGALLGPFLFALALLSAELGVGALAYIIAHAATLDPAPRARRVWAMAPYLVVLIVWRVAWGLSGAGMDGVGFYVDPLAEPLRFIATALVRAPILLLGQFALPPSELYLIAGDVGFLWAHWALAILGVIAVALIFRSVPFRDPVARFWTLGMLLALVSICATFPADRLLFFVGLGAFGLVARFLAEAKRNRIARIAAIILVAVHTGIAPIVLVLRSGMPVGPPEFMKGFLIPPMSDPALANQTLVIVTAPLVLGASYFPIEQALADLPVPPRIRFLTHYQPPIRIRRVDERSLLVSPDGGFFKSNWDRLARNERYPMVLGDRVDLSDMTAEVISMTTDGRPAQVRFTFDCTLDDSYLRWITWTGDGYAPFVPPAVGDTLWIGNYR